MISFALVLGYRDFFKSEYMQEFRSKPLSRYPFSSENSNSSGQLFRVLSRLPHDSAFSALGPVFPGGPIRVSVSHPGPPLGWVTVSMR